MLEEPGHALEQAQVVVTGGRQPGGINFGEEAGQLGSPGRIELPEDGLVRQDVYGPQGVDPGAEGQDLGALVAPPEEHPSVSGRGVGGERAEQAGLADPGLADQNDELPAAMGGLIEGLGQSRPNSGVSLLGSSAPGRRGVARVAARASVSGSAGRWRSSSR